LLFEGDDATIWIVKPAWPCPGSLFRPVTETVKMPPIKFGQIRPGLNLLFHDRIVDGIIRAGQKNFLVHPDKIHGLRTIFHGRFAGCNDIRLKPFKRFNIFLCPEHEHAAVP
jgi:hypothetical protein